MACPLFVLLSGSFFFFLLMCRRSGPDLSGGTDQKSKPWPIFHTYSCLKGKIVTLLQCTVRLLNSLHQKNSNTNLWSQVERYQLDIAGLNALLWLSRVDPGERHRAGVGSLTSPWLSASMLELSGEGCVTSSCWGKVLSVVVVCAPNSSTGYLDFWEGSHLGTQTFYWNTWGNSLI